MMRFAAFLLSQKDAENVVKKRGKAAQGGKVRRFLSRVGFGKERRAVFNVSLDWVRIAPPFFRH
jgi:hypothetical protein